MEHSGDSFQRVVLASELPLTIRLYESDRRFVFIKLCGKSGTKYNTSNAEFPLMLDARILADQFCVACEDDFFHSEQQAFLRQVGFLQGPSSRSPFGLQNVLDTVPFVSEVDRAN